MSKSRKSFRKDPMVCRLYATDVLAGDSIVMRGNSNRRVKAVHAMTPGDVGSPDGTVGLTIINEDRSGFETRNYGPDDTILIRTTPANVRRRTLSRTRAARLLGVS